MATALLTRTEVNRLSDAGVFEGRRYELIEGNLIDKAGQKPVHAGTLSLVFLRLAEAYGAALTRSQLPIEVATEDRERNEPEPDLAVLAEFRTDYFTRHPRGDELLLLIEIADTSGYFDRRVKSALYARALVREYWVLDIPARVLYVHRHPSGGAYRQVIQLAEQESVSPLTPGRRYRSPRTSSPG
jgi:hypothetical protein